MLGLTKFTEKINNNYDEKLASLDMLKYSIITNSFYSSKKINSSYVVDFNTLFNKIDQTYSLT